jgi:hypothetical protein
MSRPAGNPVANRPSSPIQNAKPGLSDNRPSLNNKPGIPENRPNLDVTGRNHQRVGSGTIAERAVDWDGYTGVIPQTSETMAEVLKNYGYRTSAFGKWHNTPADQTTEAGPFTYWPTGYGFEHFYGFLASETSQW